MAEPTFSSTVAARASGVSTGNLNFWIKTGVVKPEVEAEGSGTRRQFTLAQILGMRVLQCLREMGIETKLAGPIAEQVAKMEGVWDWVDKEDAAPDVLYSDGKRIFRSEGENEDEMPVGLDLGRPMICIPLAYLFNEVLYGVLHGEIAEAKEGFKWRQEELEQFAQWRKEELEQFAEEAVHA